MLIRTNVIPVALGAALTMVGMLVFAQATPQAPKESAASQSSIVQAIGVAEQETGGRARKVEIERKRGVDVYEIKTVAKDKSIKVLVDPASGKVLSVSGAGIFASIANLFDDDWRKEQAALVQLEASPMTLAAAIAAAERETGGRATKASLKSRDGQTLFEVGVIKDFVPHKVMVEPASGKVFARAERKDKDDDD